MKLFFICGLIFISALPSAQSQENSCFINRLKSVAVKRQRQINDDVLGYWKKEFDNALMRDRKRSPMSATQSVCTIAKNAAKVCFAPTLLMADIATTPGREFGRLLIKKKKFRILSFPVDVLSRNGPHLLGYAALSAVGFNVPFAILKNLTLLSDLDDNRSPTLPLKKDELVVFIEPASAKNLADEALDPIKMQYVANGNAANIVQVVASDGDSVIEQLGKLRQKGRIKDIHWMAHGMPGMFDMKSAGLDDIIHPPDFSGKVDSKKLDQLRPKTDQWPKDLLADDPRITLYSCDIANGPTGEKFIKTMGEVVLKDQGTIIAPAHTLHASFTKSQIDHLEHGADKIPKSMDDVVEQSKMHFAFLPLFSLIEGYGVGTVYDTIRNGFKPEPKVKVLHFKKTNRSPSPTD